MRIIAQTSPAGAYTLRFLVEASADELAKVMGQHSASHFSGHRELFVVGAEFPVSEMFTKACKMQQQPELVAGCAATLRVAADMISQPFPSIIPPEPEQPEEPETQS